MKLSEKNLRAGERGAPYQGGAGFPGGVSAEEQKEPVGPHTFTAEQRVHAERARAERHEEQKEPLDVPDEPRGGPSVVQPQVPAATGPQWGLPPKPKVEPHVAASGQTARLRADVPRDPREPSIKVPPFKPKVEPKVEPLKKTGLQRAEAKAAENRRLRAALWADARRDRPTKTIGKPPRRPLPSPDIPRP